MQYGAKSKSISAWWLIAVAFAVAGGVGGAIACGSDSSGSNGGAAGAAAIPSECSDYCTAEEKLNCGAPAHDPCVANCEQLVTSFGPCADAWRAEMRCLSDGHLACVNGRIQGNGCLNEYSAVSDCAKANPDAGILSAGGSN